jgi:hypothetical protein
MRSLQVPAPEVVDVTTTPETCPARPPKPRPWPRRSPGSGRPAKSARLPLLAPRRSGVRKQHDLDPDEISALLPVKPTRAHRKGEEFFAGPSAGNLRGRTGIRFLATDKLVPGDDLQDHLAFVRKLLSPGPGDTSRIANLRDILERTHSRAHLTCFWRGEPGEPAPRISDRLKSAIKPLAAEIETDFAVAM